MPAWRMLRDGDSAGAPGAAPPPLPPVPCIMTSISFSRPAGDAARAPPPLPCVGVAAREGLPLRWPAARLPRREAPAAPAGGEGRSSSSVQERSPALRVCVCWIGIWLRHLGGAGLHATGRITCLAALGTQAKTHAQVQRHEPHLCALSRAATCWSQAWRRAVCAVGGCGGERRARWAVWRWDEGGWPLARASARCCWGSGGVGVVSWASPRSLASVSCGAAAGGVCVSRLLGSGARCLAIEACKVDCSPAREATRSRRPAPWATA